MILLIIFLQFTVIDAKVGNVYRINRKYKVPEFTVNLDHPPKDRWKTVAKDRRQVIQDHLPKLLEDAQQRFGVDKGTIMERFTDLADKLEKYSDLKEYLEEIRGFAHHAGMTRVEIVFLSFYHEFTMQSLNMWFLNTRSHIWFMSFLQSKNKFLRNLVIHVKFITGGKQVYYGTTFAGMVGLTLAYGDRLVMTFNRMMTNATVYERLEQIINYETEATPWPVSLLIRDVLYNNTEFNLAIKYMKNRVIAVPHIMTAFRTVTDNHALEGPGVFIFRNISIPEDAKKDDHKRKKKDHKIKLLPKWYLRGGSTHRPPYWQGIVFSNSYDFRQYEWNSQYRCSNTDGNGIWVSQWFMNQHRFLTPSVYNSSSTDPSAKLIARMTTYAVDEKSIMRTYAIPKRNIYRGKYLNVLPEKSSRAAKSCSELILCYTLCLSFTFVWL